MLHLLQEPENVNILNFFNNVINLILILVGLHASSPKETLPTLKLENGHKKVISQSFLPPTPSTFSFWAEPRLFTFPQSCFQSPLRRELPPAGASPLYQGARESIGLLPCTAQVLPFHSCPQRSFPRDKSLDTELGQSCFFRLVPFLSGSRPIWLSAV